MPLAKKVPALQVKGSTSLQVTGSVHIRKATGTQGTSTTARGTDAARPPPPAAACRGGNVSSQRRAAVQAVVPLAEPLRAGRRGAVAGACTACLLVIAVAVSVRRR